MHICLKSVPCLPQKGILLKYIYMISGHSLFIGTEEVINYLEYCQLNRGKGGSVYSKDIGVEVFVMVLHQYVLLLSLEYTEPSCHYLIGSTLIGE